MKLVTTMISVTPERDTMRKATLNQVEQAGLPSPHVVLTYPGERHAWQTQGDKALQACSEVLKEESPTHVLFLEDDLLINPRVSKKISSLMQLQKIVILYLPYRGRYPSYIQKAIKAGEPIKESVEKIEKLHLWWGCQAVLIPTYHLKRLIRSVKVDYYDSDREVDEVEIGFDAYLREYMLTNFLDLAVTIPNYVQHIPSKSMCQITLGHKSQTFGYENVEYED